MKGKNNGQLRRERNKKGVNRYKQNILDNGKPLTISGKPYQYMMQPSHRLTRTYGHLIEKLRDEDGVLTGETKEHLRHYVQIVRA